MSEEWTRPTYEERFADARTTYAAGLERIKTTPEPIGQKFPVGSFVVASWNGNDWHAARVEYTYAHAYRGDNIKSYSLLVRDKYNYSKGRGNWSGTAWYKEELMLPLATPWLIEMYKKEIIDQQNPGRDEGELG